MPDQDLGNAILKLTTDSSGLDVGLQKAEGAAKGVNKTFDENTKKSKQVADANKKQAETVKNLSQTYAGIVVAIGAAIKFSEQLLNTWADQELATARLTNAVKLSKNGYEGMTDEFTKFATEMQRTSGVGDDYIQNLAAQALVMGRTEQQTKDLIRASVQLANTGLMDVNEAFKSLAATYDGMQPRNMLLRTMLGELTAAELENGAAVGQVLEKTQGMNEAMMNSTRGGMLSFKNALGDLAEGGGRVLAIFLNPSFKAISDLLNKLADFIQKTMDLRDADKALEAGTASATQQLLVYRAALKEVTDQMTVMQEEHSKVTYGYDAFTRKATESTKAWTEAEQEQFMALQEKMSKFTAIIKDLEKETKKITPATAGHREEVEKLNISLETTEDHIRQVLQLQRNQLYLDTEQMEKNRALAKSNSDLARTSGEAQKKYHDDLIQYYEDEIEQYSVVGEATKQLFTETGTLLAQGELTWESFGKAAVHSLGAIVYSLGDLLAGKAVYYLYEALAALASIIFAWQAPGLFAAAGLAGAGALLAYTAGSALKAYDTGGLIAGAPGVDTNVVRVTAGEYVVNREATAANLPTLKAMNEGGAASASNIPLRVVINLDGKVIANFVTKAVRDRQILIDHGAMI